MNYPKKPGFNLYESRHCAYITYGVKTWILKNLSVAEYNTYIRNSKTYMNDLILAPCDYGVDLVVRCRNHFCH